MKTVYIFILLILPFWALSQEIRGVVIDEDNQPLSNITVTVKGTIQQTLTDNRGLFNLILPTNAKQLEFTGMGYIASEVPIEFEKEMRVLLKKKVSYLDEVQVIGYGVSTQRFNVGSVTKIKAADIEMQAISNPLAALQGRVPGLVVTATSGLPGASFNVQIRGQNTLNTNPAQAIHPIDNPLFIIDGVPFAPQNVNVNQLHSMASPGNAVAYGNPYGGLNPFSNLNPSDIESIEVLRDADATAIYGSKGGNGVILITTKRGKSGKTSISLNASSTLSTVGKTMRMMNTQEYLAMRKEAFSNDGLIPSNNPSDAAFAPDIMLFDNNRYMNWQEDLMGNTAHNTSMNSTISGGSKQTQFRLGANLNRETYVYKGDFVDNKGGFIFNLYHTTENKRFSLNLSTNYSFNRNNSSRSANYLTAFTLQPNYPNPIKDDNELLWYYKGVSLNGAIGINPYSYLRQEYKMTNGLLNSNLQLSYKVVGDLILKSSFGYSGLNSEEYSNKPMNSVFPSVNPTASANFGTNDFTTWIVEPQLNYRKSFNRMLLDLLLGSSFQKNVNKSTLIEGVGYVSDKLLESITGATNKYASDAFSEYKYAAIFGRVNFQLNNKYILNLNARRDGSSRFGPDRQFGNFGSIGAGWLFSDEELIKGNMSVLSYGKLKGSFGITGSDAIGDYHFISRWASTNYSYRGELGYYPVSLYNPAFSWASTKKLEYGLELGFFDNKILINSTWYRNRSGNQLISYTLPGMTGFTSVTENLDAVVQNTGLEFMFQSSIIATQKFSWDASFNITIPRNKLISFPNLEKSTYSTKYIIGQPLGMLTGFKSAGVNSETGLFQFYDSKGVIIDNPLTPGNGDFGDFHNLGSLDPKFYGGVQNSIKIKNLQFDVFLEFRKQMGLNFLGLIYSNNPGQSKNIPVELENRWKAPGDKSPYQKVSSQYGEVYRAGSNYSRSDGKYSDASFLRFRTISLSYSLPYSIIHKTGLQSVRIHANAQNLFTIDNYKGNDPESQVFYGIPVLRTIGFGLQINL